MSKCVFSPFVSQNCYVREVLPPFDKSTKYEIRKISELCSLPVEFGIVEVSRDIDYPITPDYVRSFLSLTDYKCDVVGAKRVGSQFSNLGDISIFQQVFNLDNSSEIKDFASRVLSVPSSIKGYSNKSVSPVVDSKNEKKEVISNE